MRALGELGAVGAVKRLAGKLDERDGRVTTAARHALLLLGEPGRQVLVRSRADRDRSVGRPAPGRGRTVRRLVKMG